MKCNIEIKNDKVSINVSDLFFLLHDAYEDDFDAEKFIADLGWLPQVRKSIIETLKHEYSRESYNENIHKERDELLTAMKEKEIEYHTAYVTKLIEENKRLNADYWRLWHYYRDILRNDFNHKEFPPDTEKIDFDFRKKVEEYLLTLIKKEITL
jgi:hypothetical protein